MDGFEFRVSNLKILKKNFLKFINILFKNSVSRERWSVQIGTHPLAAKMSLKLHNLHQTWQSYPFKLQKRITTKISKAFSSLLLPSTSPKLTYHPLMSMKHQQCRNTSHTSSHYVREVSVVRKKWQKHLYLCELFRDTMEKITAVVQWVCQKLASQHSLKNCYCCHYHCWEELFQFSHFSFYSDSDAELHSFQFFSSFCFILLYDEERSNNFYFNFIFICLEANERLLKTFRKKNKNFF